MVKAMDKIQALGDETNIFCGHEYALSNYEFTLKFDSANEALIAYISET